MSGLLADYNPLRPGDLAQTPERVRLSMAQRGSVDTFYLATVVLGLTKLTVPTHKPLCTFLDTCELLRRIIQMPRSHFKTSIVTICHRIKNVINDPTLRILIVGNSQPNASKHLGKIKRQFESNALFRWLYPERVWEDPKGSQAQEWSNRSLYIPNPALHGEPTFDAIGALGAAVSRHYDVINPDDIIGDEEAYSEVEMERVIEWSTGLESLFVPPIEGGLLDIPCTFWKPNDVYTFLEEFYSHGADPVVTGPYSYQRGNLAVFRRGAREDGKIIFPEAVSEDFLQRLQERNPERYAAQYANDPYASGVSEFRTEWLRYYNIADSEMEHITYKNPGSDANVIVKTSRLHIVSMCDPHAGGGVRKFRGTRAAVITTGVDVTNARVYILDCWIKKAQTDGIVDEILRQNERWMPQVFSIESNGFQKMLRFWVDERIRNDGLRDVPVFEYSPQGDKDSERRIKGLQPLFRAGQIWSQRGFVDLHEEYAAYPRGFKDGLDCLAQGLLHWNIGFDSISVSEYDEYEQALSRMRNVVTGY